MLHQGRNPTIDNSSVEQHSIPHGPKWLQHVFHGTSEFLFVHFAHGVFRNFVQLDPFSRKFVGSQVFLRVTLNIFNIKILTEPQNGDNDLPPGFVLYSHHTTLGNTDMLQNGSLDFQCRNLVSPRFQNIHARPTQHSIAFGFAAEFSNVTRLKPSFLVKLFGGFFGTIPVFLEYPPALDPQFASVAFLLCLRVDQTHLDARKKLSHIAWMTISVQWIGQRHAQLRHAIAFKQNMARESFPLFQDSQGTRRTPGNRHAQVSHMCKRLVALLRR
mmetsp:Transcript_1333/g.2752  ORF Transcript_1333/g.2752 Transcript_1333/m.2752 type:complete len:272 (+) Transcript_1333:274-1089(+)